MTERAAEETDGPQNAIVILLDSLNRHMLGAYGGAEFATPNLDRFATRATRFGGHHLHDLDEDPQEERNLAGGPEEAAAFGRRWKRSRRRKARWSGLVSILFE